MLRYISKSQFISVLAVLGISEYKAHLIYAAIKKDWKNYIAANNLIDPGLFAIPEDKARSYLVKIGIPENEIDDAEGHIDKIPNTGKGARNAIR